MGTDRGTKVLLALIVVGLWAIAMAQLSPPLAAAADSVAAFPEPQAARVAGQGNQQAIPATGGPHAPTSTRPLRWRVTHAAKAADPTVGTFCTTVIQVENFGGATVPVDVEWFLWNGTSLAVGTVNVGPYESRGWLADNEPNTYPFGFSHNANLGTFLGGYARVNADDPRIMVSAFRLCRDGTALDSALVSIDSIPAYPVGATLEFFQAGMPATWIQPVAEQELPE